MTGESGNKGFFKKAFPQQSPRPNISLDIVSDLVRGKRAGALVWGSFNKPDLLASTAAISCEGIMPPSLGAWQQV